jgi:hypothetical protein
VIESIDECDECNKFAQKMHLYIAHVAKGLITVKYIH